MTIKRTYQETHPWIAFKIDLEQLGPKLWMLLGEAESKCEHICGVPLRPTTAKELHRLYLAKGALGTTSIEGNTLSEKEVLDEIDGKLKLPPSKEYLRQEVSNIIKACENIAENVLVKGVADISAGEVKELNKLVLAGLTVGASVIPGEIRNHSVIVTRIGYRGAPAEDCEYLLGRLCEWLNTDFYLRPADEHIIALAILKAIITHLYIAWIHPFGDGNGRTARLLEFKILLASGVPTPAAHLLSNFYNETREEYYRQLAFTSESGGNVIRFIEYAVKGFVDGLKTQLITIREQQLEVAWHNYIHEAFQDLNRSSDIRRRHLALDISLKKEPQPVSKLKEISPRIAAHYAKLSSRAINRDLLALVMMDLVEITNDLVRPKTETILSFLPLRRLSKRNSPEGRDSNFCANAN